MASRVDFTVTRRRNIKITNNYVFFRDLGGQLHIETIPSRIARIILFIRNDETDRRGRFSVRDEYTANGVINTGILHDFYR